MLTKNILNLLEHSWIANHPYVEIFERRNEFQMSISCKHFLHFGKKLNSHRREKTACLLLCKHSGLSSVPQFQPRERQIIRKLVFPLIPSYSLTGSCKQNSENCETDFLSIRTESFIYVIENRKKGEVTKSHDKSNIIDGFIGKKSALYVVSEICGS